MDKPHHKDPGYQVWLRADKKRREEEDKEVAEARMEMYKEKGYVFYKEGWLDRAKEKIAELGFDKDVAYAKNKNGDTKTHLIKKRINSQIYKKTYFDGDYNELWNNMDDMNPDELSKL